ncbi:tyrosine-type recombinase/integrase [Deinococcus detaillensis]|uniref:Tyrosine-type recombinase/integrase n=1 Tax=Deinococcus detaillensis TaxID=2592048 RepID=A0A553UZK1_9DEIO|nr:tyrosine-type recombinase/integrase [Deinococcus detaillensis]TSA85647.1 tyrosine-type recombinase/integrase [Deinococcus detaillensis]
MTSSTSSALVLASRWASASNRRREGLRAAHSQDAEVLTDLLHTYLRLKSSKGGRISELTLAHYAESLRKFLAFTGPAASPQHALTQLEPEVFEVWLLDLQAQGLSASSVKRHFYGVRNMMRALVWADVLKIDPSTSVRPPAESEAAHTRKSALSAATFRALLALPAAEHPSDPTRAARDYALLLLGGQFGLRAAELVGLNLDDLDLSLSHVVVRGKGKKTRQVPLTARALEALGTWLRLRQSLVSASPALLLSLSHRNAGGRLTTKGARDIAGRYYLALGLPPALWGLHTLRRTAGTQLYRATRDLHVVADVLGHASVNTSAIYAKMDTSIRREALAAVEELE